MVNISALSLRLAELRSPLGPISGGALGIPLAEGLNSINPQVHLANFACNKPFKYNPAGCVLPLDRSRSGSQDS